MINLIPHFIADNFRKGNLRGSLDASGMFVDISGFTELTEILSEKGKEGAEILSNLIKDVFTPSIRSVYNRNGFVISFEGDSFIALFPESRENSIYAASEIMELFEKYHHRTTKFGDFDIYAKIGLSWGRTEWGIVGREKKTYYFKGYAIDSCSQAEKRCRFLDIIIDGSLYSDISGIVKAKKVSDHHYKFTGMNARESTTEKNELNDIDPEVLRRFVPDALIDDKPLDELREIASIFISFRDIDRSYEELSGFSADLIEISAKWGGYFNKIGFSDKGGTALINFGCLVSYEKNIDRALNCIKEIMEIYRDKVRAGVTFGRIFSGFIGSRERSSYDVLGDAVNLSARIAMKAPWGSIWLSKNVADHAKKSFDSEMIEEFQFKGKSNIVKVYELREKKTGMPSFFSGSMFGRDPELEGLQELAEPLYEGRFGGVVYVYGDAGIGKSRLIHEFINNISYTANICFMQCDSIIAKAWNPIIYFLNAYFDQNQRVSYTEREELFEKGFSSIIEKITAIRDERTLSIKEELLRTVPFLRSILSLEARSDLYEKLDAKKRYENTIYAVKELFKALSLIRPVIIHLEDMHMLDSESRGLIKHLTRNINDFPIMLLCSARYNDDGSMPELDLEPEVKTARIILKAITDGSAGLLMGEKLGEMPDENLFEFIKSKCYNNPFFTEQFCLYLKENSFVSSDEGMYRITEKTEDVPSEINQILIARIDRLSPELKELLKIASVMGMEFDKEILFKSLETLDELIKIYKNIDKSRFDTDSLEKILLSERDNYLLEGKKSNIWEGLDDVRYAFKNSLIRESAYDMQLRERLRFLHRTIGDTIESILNKGEEINKEYYTDLAYHFEKAGINDKAVEYIEKSADHLKETYKNKESMAMYKKLLAYLEDKAKTIEINLKLGQIYSLLGMTIDAEELYKKSIDYSLEINNKGLEAESYYRYGIIRANTGKFEEALDYYEQARSIFEQTGHKDGIRRATGNMGIVYGSMGQFDKALECADLQKKYAEDSRDRMGVAISLQNMGRVYSYQGKYDKALDCYTYSMQIFEETENKIAIGVVAANMGGIYIRQNRFEKVLECFELQKDISEETGDKPGIGTALGNIGSVYYIQANYNKAIECFEQAKRISEEIGDRRGIGVNTGRKGLVFEECGEYQKALECYQEWYRISGELGDKIGIAISTGSTGGLYLKLGAQDKALRHFDRCIEIFNKINLRDPLILDCYLGKAAILLEKGDIKRSLESNDTGRKLAEEMNDPSANFRFRLQNYKINAVHDREGSFSSMIKLLNEAIDDEQRASVYYELYNDRRSVDYRNKAVALYKSLYENKKKHEYKLKIKELMA